MENKYIAGTEPYKEDEDITIASVLIKQGNEILYHNSRVIKENQDSFTQLCKKWVEDINDKVPTVKAKLVQNGK